MVASTTRSRLRACLNDVDFPADKDNLLQAAARNGCDDETTRALRYPAGVIREFLRGPRYRSPCRGTNTSAPYG
jgi:hypothetical protein